MPIPASKVLPDITVTFFDYKGDVKQVEIQLNTELLCLQVCEKIKQHYVYLVTPADVLEIKIEY